MEELRRYSLADHTMSIQSSARSIIIGNGSSVEGITISYANSNTSYTMSADGTGTLNVNYMRNGTVSVTLQATNPFVNELSSMYKDQQSLRPIPISTILVKDLEGNVSSLLKGAVLDKQPDYTATSTSGTREFTFNFREGTNNV